MSEWREPPEGWVSFGALIDYDGPTECSEETGEDGLPLWERPWPDDICRECGEGYPCEHGGL